MSMAITFKSASSPLDSKRFEIRSTLGQGGFGVVYRAFDRDLGAQVALKTLHHTNARSLYRFKREFRSLADIAHPNLATLYELIQEDSLWYFTMELVDGVDFLSWIRRTPNLGSRLLTPDTGLRDSDPTTEGSVESLRLQSECKPALASKSLDITLEGDSASLIAQSASFPDIDATTDARLSGAFTRDAGEFSADMPRLLEALRQLTWGVRALHDYGKMHRDIKPSNVLVDRQGRVVLLDFGMVADMGPAESPLQALERQSDPTKATFAGTPRYMAPEQAMGEGLDAATDWYSVGVMLYEALSGGVAPIEGRTHLQTLLRKQSVIPESIFDLAPATPPALGELCMELLSIDPSGRPGAAQILATLERLQQSVAAAESAHSDMGEDVSTWAGVSVSLPKLDAPAIAKSSRAVHFVGRAKHLQKLRRTYRDCTYANRLAVVNIQGASGMGKTTLARRFVDSFHQHMGEAEAVSSLTDDMTPVVLQGRCYANESMPFKAVDSLMDELSTYLHQFCADELADWVGEDVGALTHLFPVLERAPGLRELVELENAKSGTIDPSRVDAQLLREQAFRGLRGLLDGLARKHSLILYIDDVQWGDEDSAMLLKELLGPPNPPPIFLMSTWRSEDVESSPFLAAFLPVLDTLGDDILRLDMHLGELSDEESLELVERVFSGAPPQSQARTSSRTDAERARSIAREARGNPFFIDELARYSMAHDSGPDSGISTLGDMIYRRVAKLPAPARRLLEVLSVAGQPVDRRVVRSVAKLGEDEQSALALLRSEHLVRGKSTRDYEWLEPYHARVGETLLARLDDGARVGYHGQLAVELEQRGHFDPEAVAMHFLEAGNSEKGGHYSLLSARRAQDALAFDHAAQLYLQALDARPWPDKRAEILGELGRIYGYLGRGELAAEAFSEAAELSAPDEARELTIRAAEQLLRVGKYDRGMAVVEGVLRRVGIKPPASKAAMVSSILWLRLRLRRRSLEVEPRPRDAMAPEDYARVEVLWTAAKMLALIDPMLGGYYHYHAIHDVLDTGSADHLTLILCQQAAQEAAASADLDFAAELLERAKGYVAYSSEPEYVACYITFMLGFCDFAAGKFRSGRDRFRQAGKALRDNCHGVTWEVGYFKFFEFLPGLWLGDFGTFAREIPRLIEHATDRGDSYHRVALRSWQYPGHLANDAPDIAREELAKALAEWTRESYHIQHFWYLQGSVDTSLYAGEPAEARALLQKHQGPLKRSMLLRNEIIKVSVLNLWARTALAGLQIAEAPADQRGLAREARKYIKKLRNPKAHAWTHPLADLLDAELAAYNGDVTSALDGFERAEAGLLREDLQLYARAARRRRGQLIGGEQGAALVASADAWMREHGITNPPAMTRMLVGGAPRA
ncbi:serine/threonine-protein kinase PknK [Bradymonas sediminis]|nr:serine/threonine-protein kinase [Bradymonas sediminis]